MKRPISLTRSIPQWPRQGSLTDRYGVVVELDRPEGRIRAQVAPTATRSSG